MSKFRTVEQKGKLGISCFLFLYTLCVFLPGSYRNDTWAQFNHALNNNYGDWFDPALSFLWYILLNATGNFVSLYVLQMFLYWAFVTILTWELSIRSVQFWLATTLSTFFVVIPQYVMRDSELAIFWGLGLALLFLVQDSSTNLRRIMLFLSSALLLCYGLWVRSNSVFALIPLAAAFTRTTAFGKSRSRMRIAIYSTVASLALLAGLRVFNYKILDTYKEYPAYKLKLADLAGISKLSGENLFPATINQYPKFNLEKLTAAYTPASFDHIYWPSDSSLDLLPPPSEQFNEDVGKSWFTAIKKHPLLYLQNRAEGFVYYLRIKKRFQKEEYWNVPLFIESDNILNLMSTPNKVRDGFNIMYHKFNKTFFYDPWFWLLLNIAGFVLFSIRNKKNPAWFWEVNAAIQLSGILFTTSQFFVFQSDRDFRYSYWNVFVTFIGMIMLMRGTKKAGNRGKAPLTVLQ